MDVSDLVIDGDTPGVAWRLPVFRFSGTVPAAPSVYIQAALHAGELPGTALAHFLLGALAEAEARGAIRGDITVVPHANPIGLAQSHFGEMQGRFDLGSRTNFNRDFPLVPLSGRDGLLENLGTFSAVERLKRHVLHTALGADLVLDLHCDDESLQYAYLHSVFWPGAADLAEALDMDAVFLSDGASTAFEEAVAHAFRMDAPHDGLPAGRLAVTVELRGLADVDRDTAKRDAAGLLRFLAMRGVVAAEAGSPHSFDGPVLPLDWVEMIRAPEAGTVLFHRRVGDRVKAGDGLATIIARPGFADGEVTLHAPQDGLVVTRVSRRYVRRNGDLMKIACAGPSARQRPPGTLED
ncbi:succinylglutamate desuccinylase/aspartoacylase family protein [Rhizobiaceae bacterium BDR2-2]|uniref:Succinylglutamate desuccinylase/aspartoacylase family protein n=1 Tax=Ectorhizobium quercum TaxID=2965071 RepID=A0AAE3MXX6_9HYPH|nr:succinylglutamate desuccinylase/aspartoacylase family protein [Ectorhizobium quercum]MCX8995700.1 succinylglutamate desuccinylase/aspartoacylase family protein [Ectorhizobium quercum]